MKKVLLSWSSGKDSAWALHLLKQQPDIHVAALFPTFNSAADRVAMHAVRRALVHEQAEARNPSPIMIEDKNAEVTCFPVLSKSAPFIGIPGHNHRHALQRLSARRNLMSGMRVLRQFGVLALLLVTCLAPAMACMVPDAQMSAQERACCRTMSSQCGQTEMPASHGCCQKTPASLHNNALDTKTVTFHPVTAAFVYLAVFDSLTQTPIAAEWVERPDYSPPQSPPSSVSILRI